MVICFAVIDVGLVWNACQQIAMGQTTVYIEITFADQLPEGGLHCNCLLLQFYKNLKLLEVVLDLVSCDLDEVVGVLVSDAKFALILESVGVLFYTTLRKLLGLIELEVEARV